MFNGIIYIAFGEQYDLLAAHTISYSRSFTDLPICVITNIKSEKRCPKWSDVTGISFVELELHQNKNRFVKTSLNELTPFDRTLYLDVDSVIQRPGIERVFDMLDCHDMVLNLLYYWKIGDKVVRIAKNVMKMAGVRLPLKVYNGAFFCWDNKNEKCSDEIFPMWYDLWVKCGRGRDLFQLCCAVKKSEANVMDLKTCVDKTFSPDCPNLDCIVQHNYNTYKGEDFNKNFNLPKITEYKPFDTDPSDWTWIGEDDV